LLAGAVVVVAVHFRPWQGGLLEEWGVALSWQSEGFAGYVTRLPATLGRPLHLLPHYVGMALSDGGFVGVYALLALAAVGQFFAVIWALKPLTAAWLPRWALGLALALHPWWAAGDALRFLPAQMSVLAVAVWLAAAIRWNTGGSRWWLVLVTAAPVLGLLSYQAPAVALVAGAAAVATTATALRRGAVLVVVTSAAVVCALLWSTVVAPRLSPSSYEAQMLAGDSPGPVTLLRAVLRTLLLHAPSVLILLCLVGIVVLALGLDQRLTQWRTWTLLGIVAASPVAALVYGANTLHLRDPERLALPVGLVLCLVVASVVREVADAPLVRIGLVTAALVGSAAGSLIAYSTWSQYATAQQDLIAAAADVRADLPADQLLVVADRSGRFGDVYTLLPPYLDMAMDVEHGPGAETVLCTETGVVRNQPVAALFPLGTTPDCSDYLLRPGAAPRGEAQTSLGQIDFFVVPAA
jgi:hypothetical protein